MREITAKAMQDGALGVASALIYQPGTYAQTDELVALAEVAARYHGIYISHIRNEGDREIEAIDELISIARRAKIPAEIYHLKESGEKNWGRLPEVVRKVEEARAAGLQIRPTCTYTAGATGLDAAMPPWVQEGGLEAWRKRLQDPAIRQRVKQEMQMPNDKWDNLFLATGSPDKVLLIGFKSEKLKPLTGKTLGEVARMRHIAPEDAAMDLVIEDDSRVGTVVFPDERGQCAASDRAAVGEFRVGRGYTGERRSLFEIERPPAGLWQFRPRVCALCARRETGAFGGGGAQDDFPAGVESWHRASRFAEERQLRGRGGFRSATIQDHATFDKPMQYATGVSEVWVNGVAVVRDGEHTGAKPGPSGAAGSVAVKLSPTTRGADHRFAWSARLRSSRRSTPKGETAEQFAALRSRQLQRPSL